MDIPLISIDRASPCASPVVCSPSADLLLDEIGKLRQRLVSLESENTSLQVKLSQQHWSFENRLQELELRQHAEEEQLLGACCERDAFSDEEGENLQENSDSTEVSIVRKSPANGNKESMF